MGTAISTFIRTLIDEEVRRIVAKAIEDGVTLSAPAATAAILRTYPRCGLDERQVADRVTMAASKAGLAVELGASRRAERHRGVLGALTPEHGRGSTASAQ